MFRKSGVKSRIQALRQQCELCPDSVNYEDQSAYDVADMVKQFFRDLPEPLLTSKLGETFLHIYQCRLKQLVYLFTSNFEPLLILVVLRQISSSTLGFSISYKPLSCIIGSKWLCVLLLTFLSVYLFFCKLKSPPNTTTTHDSGTRDMM